MNTPRTDGITADTTSIWTYSKYLSNNHLLRVFVVRPSRLHVQARRPHYKLFLDERQSLAVTGRQMAGGVLLFQ